MSPATNPRRAPESSAIGFVVNESRRQASDLGADLARWAQSQGHEVRFAAAEGADPGFADGIDAVVSLGGDGTILRAIELIGGRGVPVLGVNLGQLGYLTQAEPEAAHAALARLLEGDCEIEERMLLDVVLHRADDLGGHPGGPGRAGAEAPVPMLALNEAVLEKTVSGHTVRIEVRLDGDLFTPYEADALIVATPTGSTAYAFSARGPIIAPSHRAILLTPVSPHMLFDRSLVLGPSTVIELTVASGRSATLTVDGRVLAELHDGDRLRCTASESPARLVDLGHQDFHRILRSKFGLSDR